MISAYLDGELSVEERAQVETWLAESPELRQLHDELKTLGASIQALPRHQLTQDLQGAVLRRAEQTVLAGGAARAPNANNDVRPAAKSLMATRRGLAAIGMARGGGRGGIGCDAVRRPASPGSARSAQAPKGPTSIAARQEAPSAKLAAEAQPQTSAASPAQNATAVAKPSAAMSRYAAAPGEAAAGPGIERRRRVESAAGNHRLSGLA